MKTGGYDVEDEEQFFALGDDGVEDQRSGSASPSQHVAIATATGNGHIRESKGNSNGMPQVYYDDGPFDPPSSPESEEERLLLAKDGGASNGVDTASPGAAENGFLGLKVKSDVLLFTKTRFADQVISLNPILSASFSSRSPDCFCSLLSLGFLQLIRILARHSFGHREIDTLLWIMFSMGHLVLIHSRSDGSQKVRSPALHNFSL